LAGAFALLIAGAPLCGATPLVYVQTLLLTGAAVAVAGGWLLVSLRSRAPFQRPSMLWEIFLLFLAYQLVAALLGPAPRHSLVTVRYYAVLFLLYLAATQIYRTPAQVRRLMAVLCVAIVLASLHALARRAGYDAILWRAATGEAHRGAPARVAALSALGVVLAAYLYVTGSRRWALPMIAVLLAHG